MGMRHFGFSVLSVASLADLGSAMSVKPKSTSSQFPAVIECTNQNTDELTITSQESGSKLELTVTEGLVPNTILSTRFTGSVSATESRKQHADVIVGSDGMSTTLTVSFPSGTFKRLSSISSVKAKVHAVDRDEKDPSVGIVDSEMECKFQ